MVCLVQQHFHCRTIWLSLSTIISYYVQWQGGKFQHIALSSEKHVDAIIERRSDVFHKHTVADCKRWCISMVSCQNGPTRHAYAWKIWPFWQDTLAMPSIYAEFTTKNVISGLYLMINCRIQPTLLVTVIATLLWTSTPFSVKLSDNISYFKRLSEH